MTVTTGGGNISNESLLDRVQRALTSSVSPIAASDIPDTSRHKASQALSKLTEKGIARRISRGKYVAASSKQSVQRSASHAHHSLDRGFSRIFPEIGLSFGNKRNTYEALGYPRKLSYKHFADSHKRGDIAKRIIEAPAKATWRNPPYITDDDGDRGPFAEAVSQFADELCLWKELARADIKARIGQFGVLFLGLPGSDLSREPPGTGNILFLSSFGQGDTSVDRFNTDAQSARFGLPELYRINLMRDAGRGKVLTTVHHSRVVHIAEDALEDSIHGVPALQAVFNKLIDLEKIVGGSAESVWRTFDRGIAFNVQEDADLDDDARKALDEEAERYLHGLQRYLMLDGVEAKVLGAEAADPRGPFQVVISIIAGTTGIPQRILLGSERGQLASSSDERNWNAQIRERQVTFAEPCILRPLVMRLVEVGVLPRPKGRINITWPDLTALSAQEQSQIAKTIAQATRNLVDRKAGLTFLSDKEKRVLLGMPPETPDDLRDEPAPSPGRADNDDTDTD